MDMGRASQALRGCETKLRELAQEAMGEGDYDGGMALASLAREVAVLAASTGESASLRPRVDAGSSAPTGNGSPPRPAADPAAAGPRSAAPSRLRREGTPRKAGDYPYFERENGWLFKIGWSKKEKKEYQHKASRRAVGLVADALARAGAGGRLLQASELMPLHDPVDETEVPAYQVYLTLAWLRGLNLIDPHGRRGYSVPEPAALPAAVEAAWGTLQEHR